MILIWCVILGVAYESVTGFFCVQNNACLFAKWRKSGFGFVGYTGSSILSASHCSREMKIIGSSGEILPIALLSRLAPTPFLAALQKKELPLSANSCCVRLLTPCLCLPAPDLRLSRVPARRSASPLTLAPQLLSTHLYASMLPNQSTSSEAERECMLGEVLQQG